MSIRKFEIPPMPEHGSWDYKSFKSYSRFHQRAILTRDFGDLFQRNKANHINLIGTKYNFYITEWKFGYSYEYGADIDGYAHYRYKFFDFEDMLERNLPEDVITKLLFRIDFFNN